MPSVVADIADHIVSRLNAGNYSTAITATRAYIPTFDLQDGTLLVTVIHAGLTIRLAARGRTIEEHSVQVGVQQKIEDDDNTTIDALVLLVQELADRMTHQPLDLSGGLQASYAGSEVVPVDFEELKTKRMFVGVVTLIYQVVR